MRVAFALALCMALLLPQTILHAQKIIPVHGEYTYIVPGNESLDQAKVTALERAKISILADTFGTVVGATSTITVSSENGSSDISQFTLGESSVKGEWIETTGEPEYRIVYSDAGLAINVKVRGKAREIVSAGIDINAKILRNGTDDRFESEDFKDGDQLYRTMYTVCCHTGARSTASTGQKQADDISSFHRIMPRALSLPT